MGFLFSRLMHSPSHHPHQLRVSGLSASAGEEHQNPAIIIDTYARLALLEKEIRDAHAEISRKETVIQYLLYRNYSHSTSEQSDIGQLVLDLQRKIAVLFEDNKDLKGRFYGIQNSISSLPATNPAAKANGSASSGSSTYCKGSDSEDASPQNLIDLIDLDDQPGSIGIVKTELLEDTPNGVDPVPKVTPDTSSIEPFLPDIPDPDYLHHFVHDNGENRNTRGQAQPTSKKLEFGSSFLKKYEKLEPSTDSESSSLEPLSLSSDPTSTSSSLSTAPVKECKALIAPYNLSRLSDAQLTTYAAQLWDEIKETHSLQTVEEDEPEQFISEKSVQCLPISKSNGYQMPPVSIKDDLTLRWKVSGIFDSKSEREQALSINRRGADLKAREIPYPDFFTYGIRYTPDHRQRNIYRTVIISGLPSDITLMRLLEKVRGGMVIDSKLLDTVKITGKKSALVIFLHECSAKAYENHTKTHPIHFNGVATQVAILSTPTWPIPPHLRNQIFQQARTRYFEVHNLPSNVRLSTVKKELMDSPIMTSTSLESLKMGENGILGLRFASVRAAGAAATMFERALRYSKCVVKFLSDPCDQPFDTLPTEPFTEPGFGHDATDETETAAKAPDLIDPALVDQSGRLGKIAWEDKAEISRGRGFNPEENK